MQYLATVGIIRSVHIDDDGGFHISVDLPGNRTLALDLPAAPDAGAVGSSLPEHCSPISVRIEIESWIRPGEGRVSCLLRSPSGPHLVSLPVPVGLWLVQSGVHGTVRATTRGRARDALTVRSSGLT